MPSFSIGDRVQILRQMQGLREYATVIDIWLQSPIEDLRIYLVRFDNGNESRIQGRYLEPLSEFRDKP
jgi:hypothetical protein